MEICILVHEFFTIDEGLVLHLVFNGSAHWPTFAAQIKEAVLNGVALEDDKREEFNKIEQVIFIIWI